MAKVKTLEEAKKAQTKAKAKLQEAKDELTAYLKKHKLSRDADYSKDKKHGSKIKELNLNIEKASDAMDEANAAVDTAKGGKGTMVKAGDKKPKSGKEKKKEKKGD